MTDTLTSLLADIRGCQICAPHLLHAPRPVLRVSKAAKLCIVGQAPGVRVHNTGIPFNDPSGDRLRSWMAVDRDTFYDESRIAIIPMGFCFPGLDAKGGDLPPRKECAQTWRHRLFEQLPNIEVTLLVGSYAQVWHLGQRSKGSLTETVSAWREFLPDFLPLPHPSWRNNAWLKRNSWFEAEIVPVLRQRVAMVLGKSKAAA